ncbi:hypothetical protein GCM10010269_78940 [Streptomyces humidus]|uniref:FAD/NAD(P)-binding domain-containing protein n=1 Tax=Streptomyces humidus TaxID=52259 RepID=A0A918GED4_9ACTN|nr:hypothetical protein GCM10010269_78940 [Streptomyces humidus]
MREILIAGGGYAGFYTAWILEKRLRAGEARVTVVDPRPYVTYQPFLPEAVAGSVEARQAAVSLRRHLDYTRLVAGSVTEIRHSARTVTVRPEAGTSLDLHYDVLVVTAGAVTRTFPIAGLSDQAYGLKHVEEAAAIRDCLLTSFDRAAGLSRGPERTELLAVTVVGGGFSGVEGRGELLALATALLKQYPEIGADEPAFHLVEARDRILPGVADRPGAWVVRSLEGRGAGAPEHPAGLRRGRPGAAVGRHRVRLGPAGVDGRQRRQPDRAQPQRPARRRAGPAHRTGGSAGHHGHRGGARGLGGGR